MKILHVIANLAPRYGGPSKACVEMAEAVAALGHDVSIYTTNQDGPGELDVPLHQEFIKNGVKITYFPIQWPRFLSVSLPLMQALKKNNHQFDVVHIHSLYLFHSAVTSYYSRKCHVPYVIQPHGCLDPYLYRRHRFRKMIMELLFQNNTIRNASGVLFTTTEEADLASKHIFGCKKLIAPLGIHEEQYHYQSKGDFFSSLDSELKNKKILLFFGRINFKKGFDILIPALSRLVKTIPDAYLVLAGPNDDDYLTEVNQLIHEYHMESYVKYVGMLRGEQKLAALHDADIFVLPSYTENFGIAVIEALICGTPVALSDKVNIWKEIQKADAGVVTSCDDKLFAEALIELLNDQNKMAAMGSNGQRLVKEKYVWPKVALQLEQAYFSCLDQKGESNE